MYEIKRDLTSPPLTQFVTMTTTVGSQEVQQEGIAEKKTSQSVCILC